MSNKAASSVPAKFYDYGSMAGAGFENQTQADVKIPFLGILQKLSPELSKNDPKFIPGAEEGDLLNTVTRDVYPGATGIIFQPCDTNHVIVEWKPRSAGGGFVAIHQTDSPLYKDAIRERDQRVLKGSGDPKELRKIKTPSGNDLIETFYIYGHLLSEVNGEILSPMIIACSSSKISAYRGYMSRVRLVRGRPPMFAHQMCITTVFDKNAQGQPFSNFVFQAAVNNNVMESLISPETGALLLEEGDTLLSQSRQGLLTGKMDTGSETGEATTEAF